MLVAWHVSWNAGRRCTLTPWSHRLSSRLRGAECCEAGRTGLIGLQGLPASARMHQDTTEISSIVTSADQGQHCLRADEHCSDLIGGAGALGVRCTAAGRQRAHLQLQQRAPAAKALESALDPPWHVVIAGAVHAFCAASRHCCRATPREAIHCCSRCGQHASWCSCAAAAAAIEGRCACRQEMRTQKCSTPALELMRACRHAIYDLRLIVGLIASGIPTPNAATRVLQHRSVAVGP